MLYLYSMKWGIKISELRIPTSILLHQGHSTSACAKALAAIIKAQTRATQSCSMAAIVVWVGRGHPSAPFQFHIESWFTFFLCRGRERYMFQKLGTKRKITPYNQYCCCPPSVRTIILLISAQMLAPELVFHL